MVSCSKGYQEDDIILIIISLDGFREEFLNETTTPILYKIGKKGVKANFTSLKLANVFSVHHTMATGNYPQTTGVFGPEFWNRTSTFDNECRQLSLPNIKRKLITYERRQYENYKHRCHRVTPIWTLNSLVGGTSACMMWPGCEFRYGPDNEIPTFVQIYDNEMPYTDRLEKIIEWMNETITMNPPNLVMIYFNQPDKIQHIFGPNSPKVMEKVIEIENFLKELLDKLELLNLKKRANIIFVSDHRMTEIMYKDILDIENQGICSDVLFTGSDVWLQQSYHSRENKTDIKMNGEWHWQMNPVRWNWSSYCSNRYVPECYSPVYNKSKCIKTMIEQRMPKSLMLKPHSIRGGDNAVPANIIANYTMFVADVNYSFNLYTNVEHKLIFAAYGVKLYPKIEKWMEEYDFEVEKCTKFGVHGYWEEETGFFMATGPVFAKNKIVPRFEVPDLYILFVKILEIRGFHERDGNFSRVEPVLEYGGKISRRNIISWQTQFEIILGLAVLHCSIFYVSVEIYLSRERRGI